MSYSSVAQHRSMVFDDHRNELYRRAIAHAVSPGAVVLDLGAGLGIHGLLAAAAGASRVYLVEPEPVVQLANEIARACGFGAQIIALQGRIEDLTLPEKVDTILSVLAGNLLFSEDLLPALFHARDRYLRAGGRLIPDRAQLWLAPLNAPELHATRVACWSEPIMGLDFSRARAFAANEIVWLRREDLAGSVRLSAGAALADLDLASATNADCRGEASCLVEKTQECHGLLGWIRLRIGDEWLSSDPSSPEVHWSPVVLPIDPPLSLIEGETLEMTLQRPAHGDWTWSLAARTGRRRHSTFLAKPQGPRDLARFAITARNSLNDRGQRAARTLGLFERGLSTQEVVAELLQTSHLPRDELLHEVQALALRYGQP